VDLAEYPLKGAISTGIELSPTLFEWEAAHAAGLDLERWDAGEYSPAFQARVLAWYSRHEELEQHREDARARAAEQKMKRRG
jgi:hypothetical protein